MSMNIEEILKNNFDAVKIIGLAWTEHFGKAKRGTIQNQKKEKESKPVEIYIQLIIPNKKLTEARKILTGWYVYGSGDNERKNYRMLLAKKTFSSVHDWNDWAEGQTKEKTLLIWQYKSHGDKVAKVWGQEKKPRKQRKTAS